MYIMGGQWLSGMELGKGSRKGQSEKRHVNVEGRENNGRRRLNRSRGKEGGSLTPVPLSTDVRSNAKIDKESSFCCLLQEQCEVGIPLKVVLQRAPQLGGLVEVPEDVCFNHVQAIISHCLEEGREEGRAGGKGRKGERRSKGKRQVFMYVGSKVQSICINWTLNKLVLQPPSLHDKGSDSTSAQGV